MKKEGIMMETVDDTDHDNLGNDADDGGEDEGDLFGILGWTLGEFGVDAR